MNMISLMELYNKAYYSMPEAKNMAKHKQTCEYNRRKRKNKRKKK